MKSFSKNKININHYNIDEEKGNANKAGTLTLHHTHIRKVKASSSVEKCESSLQHFISSLQCNEDTAFCHWVKTPEGDALL